MRQSETKNRVIETGKLAKKSYRVSVTHYPDMPNFTAVHSVDAHSKADAIARILKKLKFRVEKLGIDAKN